MNIDALIDMPDGQFTAVVLQAVKRRDAFPEWWRLVLSPEVIDDTERVIQEAMGAAAEQAKDPLRYPYAGGFAKKMQSVLAEITLARIVAGD